MVDVAEQRDHGGRVHVDLDTLATALYVKIDHELRASPHLDRWRPRVGIAPRITDAELITVSVMRVLSGFHNESRWIRFAPSVGGVPIRDRACCIGACIRMRA
jgi:hypothetical protein